MTEEQGRTVRRILLIVPSMSYGGTNTSANNLLGLLHGNRDIEPFVFAIDHSGGVSYATDTAHLLSENGFLAMYTGKMHTPMAKIGRFFCRAAFYCLRLFGYETLDLVYRRVAKQVQARGFDVVIGFQEGAATRLAAQFVGCRRIAWIRCDYNRYRAHYPDAAERKYYAAMDNIVCVSAYTRGTFTAAFPEFAEKTLAIHNPIDSERICRMAADRSDVDARFCTDAFTLLSVGRLDPVKQFDRIPGIAQKLKARGLTFRWYILGGGPEMAHIETEIARCGVADCIQLLGATGNPYAYMAQSDLYVCTSRSEACPNVINEARILHVPIVSTDFPSAKEFLTDGENGYLAPIEELDRPIARMITERDAYEAIRANIAAYQYDNAAILEKLRALFAGD